LKFYNNNSLINCSFFDWWPAWRQTGWNSGWLPEFYFW